MTVKKGAEPILEVADLAFGGKGLARVNGLAVFVDGAVPGDQVRARIIRKKRNYAEARVAELIRPSSLRVAPPCPYQAHCGGCKWQFLGYDHQLEYKRRHVAESLAHIGLIQGVPVHPTLPSERVFGYRNKMEFSCSDRRWLLPAELGDENADIGFALGLHVPGTFHKVLDIERCLLQPELGNQILADARAFMKRSALAPYGLKSHEGFWRFLMLRHGVAEDQWMVNIVTAWEEPDEVRKLAAQLRARYPAVVSVVNNITARKSGVAFGEYEVPLAGSASIQEQIGEYRFKISANSFFQTNTRGARRLYDTVKQYARLDGSEQLLDLYCGTGTIAIHLSDSVREVVGLELVESAVADARENARLNRIENCRFVGGDLRQTLADAGFSPAVMVIDPPRAGMHKDVVAAVTALGPQRIVYVSCNPATLARDLGMLKEQYAVREVQPVDMFPHTFHIESVARLEKR